MGSLTNSIGKIKLRFAQRTALRIALAATLSLIIALIIPFSHAAGQLWFGWFAPFSVIINMLMFPHQSAGHQIMVERLISITVGTVFGLLMFFLFKNTILLFCIVIFLFNIFCMYQVGRHHRYHYGYFLAMIFATLVVGFVLMNVSLLSVIWEFPVSVILALISIVIIDYFIPSHTTAALLPVLNRKAFKLLTTAAAKKPIDLALFHYWHSIILAAKEQITTKKYHAQSVQNHLMRVIALKLNLINKHYRELEAGTIKKAVRQCYAAFVQVIKTKQVLTELQQAIVELQEKLATYSPQKHAAWICLNEWRLIHEDLNKLLQQAPEEHKDLIIKAPSHAHVGFNHEAFVFSVRMVTSVAVAMACIVLLKVPGGMQTVIATIVSAAAPNMGASVLKFLMRASGILVGTLAGLLVALIVIHTQMFTVYLLLFFLFIFWACRWSLISQYGYAGIQAALIFLILVGSTGSSGIDPGIAFDRFFGVFVGSLITFVVVFLLAPVAPAEKIKEKIQAIILLAQEIFSSLRMLPAAITPAKLACAQIDEILKQYKDLVHEQRFLLLANAQQQAMIINLQNINNTFKQIIRALESAGSQAVDAAITAKIDYCYKQIMQNWNEFCLLQET